MSRQESAPPLNRDQEDRFLERLRAGDRTAQSELVLRYQPRLQQWAMKFLKDRALAEDVVQDTWLLAFARMNRFEGRSTLFTWLTGIMVNRAKDYRRKGFRVQPFSSVGGQVEPQEELATADSTRVRVLEAVTEATAEGVVLQGEQNKALHSAVQTLPETLRAVLLLHLRGYDSRETREALRITDLARRLRLSRALSRLRVKLVPLAV